MASFSGRDLALSFIGGFLLAVVLIAAVGALTLQNSDAYGLGHWKLNARMPLATTWINLGYWTNDKDERIEFFNEACAQLLKEILRSAGLLPTMPSAPEPGSPLAVVDLGFGCGDQTLELVKLTQPSLFTYVGLTLDQAQVTSAYRNIHDGLTLCRSPLSHEDFKLFCADAARPETWNPQVRKALEEVRTAGYQQRWLLALDCLYHFRPSRRPVYAYAARELAANAMAFDLLLNPDASKLHTFFARLICAIMRCPWKAFLTEEEYRADLVSSGYGERGIEIRDITEHVFLPVADFLEKQERRLAGYGVSMAGHKLAGRIFEWFGRSGVVKAVIVVARVSGERHK